MRHRHIDRTLALAAALIVVCGAGVANAQTNPCTQPLPTTVVLNPKVTQATLGEQDATQADGTPMVTEYAIGYFAQGVDPSTGGAPTQVQIVGKASWTLEAGTTDCYRLTPITLTSIPVGQRFVAAIKARRVDQAGIAESEWSAISNPFGRSAAPGTPGRPVLHQ